MVEENLDIWGSFELIQESIVQSAAVNGIDALSTISRRLVGDQRNH